MKIIGLGIDIVKNGRLTKELGERFLTPQENAYFKKITSESRTVEFLAGR